MVGIYSFNNGKEAVEGRYPHLLKEIQDVVRRVDASKCRTKKSREKTMKGRLLYSPTLLNKAFSREFERKKWVKVKIKCQYSAKFYTPDYVVQVLPATADGKKGRKQEPYREMDFVKDRLGVEVQFGKYSFMVYNVCAKMTIFSKLDLIDVGVEIVPVQAFTREGGKRAMSTGVSYFEQFVWDLEQRGVADIDIPVLILGIQ